MSLPRPVIPGRTYLITRCCSERRYFLRPDHETNTIFLYCLGYAAQQAKVGLTFFTAMSNHYHAGINDREGTYPVFLERFHSLLARCQNAHWDHTENLWSSDPTSVVRLVNPADAFDKLIYTFANPAAADLVDTIHDWPGAHSLEATLSGKSITIDRPKLLFREDGEMPKSVTLTFERPIGLEAIAPADWVNQIKTKLKETEAAHRERRRAAGKNVLGRRRVLAQSPFASPATPAPQSQINPKIAAKSKWSRIEAIRQYKDFVNRHRNAFLAHMAGLANFIFPYGTYWWRKFGRLPCEGDPCSSLDPCPSPA